MTTQKPPTGLRFTRAGAIALVVVLSYALPRDAAALENSLSSRGPSARRMQVNTQRGTDDRWKEHEANLAQVSLKSCTATSDQIGPFRTAVIAWDVTGLGHGTLLGQNRRVHGGGEADTSLVSQKVSKFCNHRPP
jgi:hypothetical protein